MQRVWVRQMFGAIADLGRQYLLPASDNSPLEAARALCGELLSHRGEASGTALAREVIATFAAMDEDARLGFLTMLSTEYGPDTDVVSAAARDYADDPGDVTYSELIKAIESPRQELIRRLNMAPGGTAAIVDMRASLVAALRDNDDLKPLEQDLRHLLGSWFNRGFLQFERIDWRTPAVVLEKLIAYEAVHEIQGWDDLRRRLADDRRCFAFFHPALPDEPLIFVEVALVRGIAGEVEPLLQTPEGGPGTSSAEDADTAIFYSISNCQAGLAGISFGNFLIKQVADTLSNELPGVRTFATLSPIPGFMRWLLTTDPDALPISLNDDERALIAEPEWWANDISRQRMKGPLQTLCSHYLLNEKRGDAPRDSVSRFHLGNGASIERLNWAADHSAKGLQQSAGMMVNYLYERDEIVANHEAFSEQGRIVASATVKRLAG